MGKLVIFDFDGTLARLDIDYDNLRKSLREYFLGYGIDMTFRPLQKRALEAVRMAGRERSLEDTNRIIDRFEMERIENSRVVEGAEKTLKGLKKQGCKIAILSNNGRAVIRELLSRHGILGYFDFIGSRNNVPEVKPSARGVLMVMERLGFGDGDGVFMVGDSMYDMASAEQAGVHPVCVIGSEHSREVRERGKYAVLSGLPELSGYLSTR
jgi:HAD superfamily hydrolase (TIGR01549 family)